MGSVELALGRKKSRAKKRPKKAKRGPLAKVMAKRRAVRAAQKVGDSLVPFRCHRIAALSIRLDRNAEVYGPERTAL